MIEIINHNTLSGIPLDDNSIDCVVTSPPYWGLRDYGADGQLGLEKTPAEYVENMRVVFADVRRVLKPEGTLWLNLGDSFASSPTGSVGDKITITGGQNNQASGLSRPSKLGCGLKPKDLCGIPWRVAFALQADGWYLRNDIIWHKPNPMPESVTDRCTRAHEYVFHMSKSAKYFYDAGAIREADNGNPNDQIAARLERAKTGGKSDPTAEKNGIRVREDKQRGHSRRHAGFNDRWDLMTKEEQHEGGRNKRTVWTIATQPTPDAHFATYPEKLVEPCILAGCPVGGTVLDPFCGSGTTLKVAERLGRNAIGLELNPEYIKIAERKTAQAYLEGVA